MPRTTAATKRAIWWTVSSRMRDGDAGDDDGAAILDGIPPSRLPFRPIFELRRQAIAGRLRRRTSKVSFPFQSFNRFGSMERAPKVCLFVCILSSRDRLKFKLHFLKFPNENADLAPLQPYCAWDGEWRRAL